MKEFNVLNSFSWRSSNCIICSSFSFYLLNTPAFATHFLLNIPPWWHGEEVMASSSGRAMGREWSSDTGTQWYTLRPISCQPTQRHRGSGIKVEEEIKYSKINLPYPAFTCLAFRWWVSQHKDPDDVGCPIIDCLPSQSSSGREGPGGGNISWQESSG